MHSYFWRFFSFLALKMDPIFKDVTLKKEYENLHKNILPKLNNCGNCNIFKCEYCKKFSLNCQRCISKKCKYCHEFNKSKDILLNSSNLQISWYISNFLIDYFSLSDFSNQFF